MRQAHIVHTPTVDADGGDALGGDAGGFAQAFLQAGKDGLEGPVHMLGAMNGAVGNAMDDFDGRLAIEPAQQ